MTARDRRLVAKLRALGIKYPKTTLEESKRAGLPLSLACGLLQQESPGTAVEGATASDRRKIGINCFGHDRVANTVKGGYVTRARYAEYKRQRRAGRGANGVGPCQLTYWATQDQADREGGCWKARINMRVGFRTLAQSIKARGMVAGIAAYNDGSGRSAAGQAYSRAVRRNADWFHRRLTA